AHQTAANSHGSMGVQERVGPTRAHIAPVALGAIDVRSHSVVQLPRSMRSSPSMCPLSDNRLRHATYRPGCRPTGASARSTYPNRSGEPDRRRRTVEHVEDLSELLCRAARYAAEYRASLATRPAAIPNGPAL